MSDYLVKLYDMPYKSRIKELEADGIRILRPLTATKQKVLDFVEKQYSKNWSDECSASFCRQPVSCFIALNKNNEILGFACYEATYKNYFGPIGMSEQAKGKGIGAELLYQCMIGLKESGYAYAIIGGVSESVAAFYKKVVYAEEIKGSSKGIYKNLF
jgi:hypothetical protein